MNRRAESSSWSTSGCAGSTAARSDTSTSSRRWTNSFPRYCRTARATRNPARHTRNCAPRFPDWAAVRDAPVGDMRDAIKACNWPEQKAPRIQLVLRLVTERRGGDLALDFLEHLSVRDARVWLETLPGVGPKTSAAVLIFSRLRKRALPVDSHHHRVAQRLGLIPQTLAVGPAHAVLEAILPPHWDAQKVYDDHEILMFHGQRCCFFRGPECPRCVLLDLCPTGQAHLERTDKNGASARLRKNSRTQPGA